MNYVHSTGDEDLGYSLQERVVEYNGRKLLYLLSELSSERFALGCGPDMLEVSRSDTRTAYVKGYISKWKYAKDEHGADVSELEAINSKEQEALRQLIESDCNARLIYFE